MVLLALTNRLEAAPIFEESVAPIFDTHCTECHNDQDSRKGELDLSSAAGLMKGGENGPVFVPNEPEKSHLFELVHEGKMPKKGDPLSASEIETIRNWIASGASFRESPVLAEAGPNQHDVIPIMLLRCTACHGPQRQDGGLDLRTPASMRKGGHSGPAFVAGDPDGSLMIQRIESEACPPQALLLKAFVKRPPESDVETLRHWIAAGAPEVEITPDVATTEPDPLVSDEDRQHWAFQPPKVTPGAKSIDDFVGKRLAEAGLEFSPEADRDTLIRRAWLDLLGIPPEVEEWRYWRESNDPDWFATMIDQLLASPRYGERWGRYWLDLAGYADSEGGTSADPLRPVAWKYRDYVIHAFNTDKPYDEFLLEQIAGDELIDIENADSITDEMVENLVATGFLRMGIDETGSRTMNFVENRVGVIADVIDVLGSSIMGLTMECVRCHSHKYDPIPQRDYYRLKAVFQGALDEYDWLSFQTRTLDVGTPEQRARVDAVNPALEAKLKELESLKRKKTIQWQREMLRAHYPDQPENDREATFKALKRADNTRSLTERRLVEKLQLALVIPNHEQPPSVQAARTVVDDLDQQIEEVTKKMAPALTIRALWDRGDPSPTYIFRRGLHTSPGRLVGPGVPSVLTDGKTPLEVVPPFPDGTPKTGRRLAFAKWLTRPDHPLTARVMVNRMWHYHFGRGIVPSLENFGIQGEAPTHPELLDWLAVNFVEQGWSLKEMHRLMMNSRTWKQSSRVTDELLAQDPDNDLFSRMPLRRMDAEALRDSLLFVSGKLDNTAGGPPDRIEANREGGVQAKATTDGHCRRSIYLQYRRTEIPTMMETFDYPEMGPNCVTRSVSTVSPQSLMLMNNRRVRDLAAALASRIDADEIAEKIDAAYEIALSRNPTDEERALGIETLAKLEAEWPENPAGALEAYCHALLNSAAFLYVD
ncbi:MAG: PSD1 domain-containing protein [Verrucomicrobiae bacterium]|nr:PSD1 domain-containing protein [Verrucomicrobiae bacterium]